MVETGPDTPEIDLDAAMPDQVRTEMNCTSPREEDTLFDTAQSHGMVITNNELVHLGFLECVAAGVALPDGCDTGRFASLGWIAQGLAGAWTLTTNGERSLASLREANHPDAVGT